MNSAVLESTSGSAALWVEGEDAQCDDSDGDSAPDRDLGGAG